MAPFSMVEFPPFANEFSVKFSVFHLCGFWLFNNTKIAIFLLITNFLGKKDSQTAIFFKAIPDATKSAPAGNGGGAGGRSCPFAGVIR